MNIASACDYEAKGRKDRLYGEYYFKRRDDEGRRSGDGENHWTGAQSMEWYRGEFSRDTMNGYGDYRWHQHGPKDASVTFEGYFFANKLHGHGTMSYPDGITFRGLYYKDMRWGPGVQYLDMHQDVGFWRGNQLVRLAWRPKTYSVAPDLPRGENGKAFVEKFRTLMVKDTKVIGKSNSAVDLLKECGMDPMEASKHWSKLYANNCTDLHSPACDVNVFENSYYRGQVNLLRPMASDENCHELAGDKRLVYAWNNNKMIVHMMRHCFKHDHQRSQVSVDLETILNGSRNKFRTPGPTEMKARSFFSASFMSNKDEPISCDALKREADRTHEEYYFGKRDRKRRRNGAGDNHWTGTESVEWYRGHFVRDAMNGYGVYRWRYHGIDDAFVTYEGHVLGNALHGYGVMSYPDGRTFTGLYYKNIRWGPGVEFHANLKQNVGFWRGTQLVRLSWRPLGPSVAMDLITGPGGKAAVAPFRVLLAASSEKIGETNSAIELLKQAGAEPLLAADKWPKLYSKHCTDLNSIACHADVFLKDFYDGSIKSLKETDDNIAKNDSQESSEYQDIYYAWNNSHTMLHMMKHCFKHEHQRPSFDVKLAKILNGPRRRFRPAGRHESDCRKLLMASYNGQIENVARLINECEVYPDLSDIQGNTALMYAACGDQPAVIHFLVDAGANVNSFNDVCVTPLGAALMRYACVEKNILPNAMVQAVLPEKSTIATGVPTQEPKVDEWLITREIPIQEPPATSKRLSKSHSRMKNVNLKKSVIGAGKKSDRASISLDEQEFETDESVSDNENDKKNFMTINEEYNLKVSTTFSGPHLVPPYLFTVRNMVDDIVANSEVPKDTTKTSKPKDANTSKNLKAKSQHQKSEILNVSKDMVLESVIGFKVEILNGIKLTIQQLLADGADPRLVRCPQPALYTAVVSGSADLIQQLIQHGASVNETFSEAQNYPSLAIAVTGPLNSDTVHIIRVLLINGADANIRLHYPEVPGPTLLHAILAKKVDSQFEEDIANQIMELLLEHHCDPYAQFKGRSAIDVAMTKRIEILDDVFSKNPNVDLNKVINCDNQTILVKLFNLQYFRETAGTQRFSILTSLLLHGADPLLECQDGQKTYGNLFVYAQETLEKIAPLKRQGSAISGTASKTSKGDAKGHNKSETKGHIKSETKGHNKSETKAKVEKQQSKGDTKQVMGKRLGDEISDYTSTISLMTECICLLHVRWLQAKLMKELVDIIYKYQHRQWCMIIKEHKNQKGAGIWLTPQRCLEIWDILKTTKKKFYTNGRILKYLLYIVQFYNRRSNKPTSNTAMTAPEKTFIEMDMGLLLKEHKAASKLAAEAEAWKRVYVKPELEVKADHKYKICFECALPLNDYFKILCSKCELVSFCNLDCIKKNIDRKSHHPCNEYLKDKYFPTITIITESMTGVADNGLEILPTSSSIKAIKVKKRNKAVADTVHAREVETIVD